MQIAHETDVVVVGGGTAGFIAAIAAARNGARTLIVERNGFLGGTPVAGLMTIYITFHSTDGTQIAHGIPEEMIQRLIKNGGTLGHCYEQQGNMYSATPLDAEAAKYTLLEMAEEAGVEVLFDSICTDALVYNGAVRGLVVANKSGNQVILAKRVVDCTGDADVAARAGAAFDMRSKDMVQPVTLMFRMGNVNIKQVLDFMKENPDQFQLPDGPESVNRPWLVNGLKGVKVWREAIQNGELTDGFVPEQGWFHTHAADMTKGEVTFNMTRVTGIDGTNAQDLSRAHVRLQKQVRQAEGFLRKRFPGFDQAYLIESAPMLGVRETRRIIGEYILTKEDIVGGVRHEDTVALSAAPIDIHDAHGEGKFHWIKTGTRGSIPYGIPYRCLVPRDVDNLVVAGRCVSTTWEASGSVRLQVGCMTTGEAAGTAAALSLRENVAPRKLDVKLIQQTLRANGAAL